MNTRAVSAWKDAQTKKQSALATALNREALKKRTKDQSALGILLDVEIVTRVESFEVFEAHLNSTCQNYTQCEISRLVGDKLYPYFDRVKSFTNAISACTQAQGYASLCWGTLLIVIQCGCMVTESLQATVEHLSELYQAMPMFAEDLELYPNSERLGRAMCDIFEDFLDYYIQIIRSLRRKYLVTVLRTLVAPSFEHELGKTKKKLANHIDNFHKTVDLVHRRKAEENHEENKACHAMTLAKIDTIIPAEEQSTPQFPLNTVNLLRNMTFTGRDSTLKLLHQCISRADISTQSSSCTLYGIGGVGKTQIALEYTYKFREQYDCIFWLRAAQDIELLNSYGTMGRKLGLISGNDVDQPAVEKIQGWLEKADLRKLLVFDNVRDWESVSKFWPMSSEGKLSIIVTAQAEISWTDTKLPIEPLPPDLGSRLLLKQLDSKGEDGDRELAKEISHCVGGLPLWLNQVSGLIKFSNCSLSEFRDSHQSSSKILEEGENKGDNWRYEKAISAVFDDALRKLPCDAKELLYMLTFLNPDETNEEMLLSNHASDKLAFLRNNNDKDRSRYLRMIQALRISQLVHREASGYKTYLTTHRSLQEGLMQKLNKDTETRQMAFERATLLLRENFPSSSRIQQADPEKWPLIGKILPHVLSLLSAFKRAEPSITSTITFAELLADVGGMNMFDRGFVRDAQTILKAAESTLDDLHEPKHSRLRGDIVIVLGLITDHVGITERLEGLDLRYRAKEIREECFSDIATGQATITDEILLFNSYTDLACSLQHLNRFDEVEMYCQKCLQKYKSWGSEDDYPYEYAKYYHHMAFVYVHRKNTVKATEYGKRGADLMAQAVPGAQIGTIYRFDWAVFLFQNDETDRAIKEHETIFEQRKNECGNLNLLTIQSRLMLGVMCFRVQRLEEAESWLRQTLTLDHKIYWPQENVARAKFYLSQVLRVRGEGDSKEAMRLEEEAMESLRNLLTIERGEAVAQYLGKTKPRYDLLFDFLVPWGYRIFVPQIDGAVS